MGLFECTSDDLVEECNESYKRNDDAGAASRNNGTEERSQPSFLNTTQPVGCQFVIFVVPLVHPLRRHHAGLKRQRADWLASSVLSVTTRGKVTTRMTQQLPT